MDMVVGTLARGREEVSGSGGLDGSAIFRVASLSKVLTMTALARMVEQGALGLDDPVAAHLPGFTLPGGTESPILVWHLATHTSGLRDPHYPGDDGSLDGLAAGLAGMSLESAPGTVYSYCNVGASLLGNMLALVAGTGFGELVDELVCRPLRMPDTVLELDARQAPRWAVGHENGEQVATPTLALHAPSGGYYSTVNDMLRFLRAQLAQEHALTHRTRFTREPGSEMGLGWHIDVLTEGGGGRMLWHNGSLRGYRSFLGFVPAAGSGVVALGNSERRADEIARRTLGDMVRGE